MCLKINIFYIFFFYCRRRDIRKLNSSLLGSEILLIDELMSELGVTGGVNGWGDSEAPIYPPPSLQALLNLYLLPDIPLSLKHRIVQYLFMDLSSILTDGFSSAVEQLIKFPASAKLSPSIIKLTQAFWLLDQKDFPTSVSLFLDPLVVRTDITVGQHRRVLRALLYQNEVDLALSYLNGRQPPLQQLEDIQLHLSVLLANGRVREAFHFQRQHANVSNEKDLLAHLLQGLEHYSHLGAVVQLPLLPREKASFLSFLRASLHPHAKDVLTLWCLTNGCFSELTDDDKETSDEKDNARVALIRSYTTHLPYSSSGPGFPSKMNGKEREIYSPQKPLSAQLKHLPKYSPSVRSMSRFETSFNETTPSAPFTPFRSYGPRKSFTARVNLLSGSKLPTTPSDMPSTVLFPSRVDSAKKQQQQQHSVSNTSINTLLNPSFDLIINSSSLRNASPHITHLLKTPPVHRRPSMSSSTIDATPQSILKVIMPRRYIVFLVAN